MLKIAARVLLFGPLLVLYLLFAAWVSLPWPFAYRWVDPGRTAMMKHRLAEARAAGETLELKREWVELEEISPAVVRAVIAAEDGRFREHDGIDWYAVADELHYRGGIPAELKDPADRAALLEAARYYRDNRAAVKGRSTITQQLAKNLYWGPERSLSRKIGELFVAGRLERFLSKDRILELYLNTVELGPGVFGVEAAAREYWGRSAGELTSYQAASLAGTLPHPLTSNPGSNPGRLAWRRDLILARLAGGSTDRSPVPVAPEVAAPAVEVQPDTAVAAPDTVRPDTARPDTARPDTARPDTVLPDTVPPDTTDTLRAGGER